MGSVILLTVVVTYISNIKLHIYTMSFCLFGVVQLKLNTLLYYVAVFPWLSSLQNWRCWQTCWQWSNKTSNFYCTGYTLYPYFLNYLLNMFFPSLFFRLKKIDFIQIFHFLCSYMKCLIFLRQEQYGLYQKCKWNLPVLLYLLATVVLLELSW